MYYTLQEYPRSRGIYLSSDLNISLNCSISTNELDKQFYMSIEQQSSEQYNL